MKLKKTYLFLGIITIIMMVAFSGCFASDAAQSVGETFQDASDHMDEPIPATASSLGKATGIPYAGEALGFLTSLLIGVVTNRKRKEAEAVAGEMAKAIEKSGDKAAIASEVERKVGLMDLAKLALKIVNKATN